MSNVTSVPGFDVNPEDFWVASGEAAQNEALNGFVKQTGGLLLGIGTSRSYFTELTLTSGALTYHYVGEWVLKVSGTGLTATTTVTGSYDKVKIERAGDIVATLNLEAALKVDVGTSTDLSVLGINLSELLNPILETLLGSNVDADIANLHLDASPDLTDLVDLVIDGGTTDDGTSGNDVLNGTSGADTINGLGGDDRIHGGGGADTIHGNDGNDRIWGQGGNDLLFGDAGNDIIWGGPGRDIIRGGAGKDQLYGGNGSDKLFGDGGRDIIHGGNGSDLLVGGAGRDTLYGEAGRDVLIGNGGRDILVGGAGRDILTGGGGADVFDFNFRSESTAAKSGRDFITDFSRAQGDKIDVSTIDADTTQSGNQSFDFIGSDAFSDQAGELRFVKKNGDTFVQADTNGDGKADFSIQLDHAINLHATDFFL